MSSITDAGSVISTSPYNQTTKDPAVPTKEDEQASKTSDVPSGWDKFIPDVEADPAFAKQMAEDVTFIPDKLLLNLSEALPLTDIEAYQKWIGRSTDFDKVAAGVTEQRKDIYNNMKADGASDAEYI